MMVSRGPRILVCRSVDNFPSRTPLAVSDGDSVMAVSKGLNVLVCRSVGRSSGTVGSGHPGENRTECDQERLTPYTAGLPVFY